MGDVKVFAVGFAVRQLKILADALGDGMAVGHGPDAFFFSVLTPAQVAGGAHHALEDL